MTDLSTTVYDLVKAAKAAAGLTERHRSFWTGDRVVVVFDAFEDRKALRAEGNADEAADAIADRAISLLIDWHHRKAGETYA